MSDVAPTSTRRWWLALPVVAFAVLLVRSAWYCDDAYITFRTVDNFLNGFGLTWNVHERVQAYTHPLWMFLVAGLVSVTREYYVTVIAFSMLLALATMALVTFRRARSLSTALFVGTLLVSSKAFVEYSTGGLENPLSNLLLVVFIGIHLADDLRDDKLLRLAFVASLGMLNRMDTALFYAPALAFELWNQRSLRALGRVALGFAPMIAWEAFSLAYYGFLFPNTAYAKLNTGIAGADLAHQGVQYCINAFENDPVTVVGIGIGITLPMFLRLPRAFPIVLGTALYLAYVVKVGGDFMMGRFLAAPLVAAATLLAALDWRPKLAVAASVVAIGLALFAPRSILTSGADYGAVQDSSSITRRVGDQRFMYYVSTGLLNARKNGWEPVHPWVDVGRDLKRQGHVVKEYGATGFKGFFAGPEVVILDHHALSDALLARLPADERKDFIVAHFKRTLPAGYEASVRSGTNQIEDVALARYYAALVRITQGALWSAERWRAILDMQCGRFDGDVAAYVARREAALHPR